jgi:hypothetical protein
VTETADDQPYEPFVEPGVREGAAHLAHVRPRQAEAARSEGQIDEVRAAEHFHQRITAVLIAAELVVLVDHQPDFVLPALESVRDEVLSRGLDGRREVVERAAGPDAEVVEGSGDFELATLLVIAPVQRQPEVNDALDVVAVALEVAPNRVPPGGEDVIGEAGRGDGRQCHRQAVAGVGMG